MPKAKVNAKERKGSMGDSERNASLHPVMNICGHAGQKRTIPPVRAAGEGRYLLRLGNGHGWEMVADERVGSWLDRLASIMRLESCEPGRRPQLVFTRRKPGASWMNNPAFRRIRDLSGNLPQSGWEVNSLWSVHFWTHCGVPDVICELEEGDEELEIVMMELSLYPAYVQVQETGGLPFHTALVERDGKAVLLPASGGTGKSTCCRRIPHPWRALSDDLSLVVADGNGNFRAHPFPTWSDYLCRRAETTWDVQRHLPLSAIFFLEQGETDEAIPIGQGQAAALIAESAGQICRFFLRDLAEGKKRMIAGKIFRNACEISKAIPAFRLRVSMEGRFWEAMERIPE
jgi:SynChlorMet cassette protein ScmC